MRRTAEDPAVDEHLVDDDSIPTAPPNIWLAVYSLIIPPAVIWLFPFDAVATVAGIAWVMGSLPLSIMIAIDWYRYPAVRTGTAARVRATLRGPILLLGVIAVVIGLVVLLWIVNQVFWERDPQVGLLGLAGGVVFYLMMIAVGLKLIRMALTPTRTSDRPSWTGP